MIKDLIISISIANLCLIRGWEYVNFTLNPACQYYFKNPSSINHIAAVMLFIVVLSATFFVVINFVRRSGNQIVLWVARVAFLLLLTLPLNGILLGFKLTELDQLTTLLFILFLILLIILIIRLSLCFRKHIFSIMVNIVCILFPFFLFNLIQTTWLMIKFDPANLLDKSSAKIIETENASTQRVLWLIFDEMGQQMTFENRPQTINLPEIDRLKEQAFYASYAYPPGDETGLTLPSLISGKQTTGYKPFSPEEMIIRLHNSDEDSVWSNQPDIFSKAYELGYNTKLIGWYLPYGRVLGNSLTKCSWYPYETYRPMSLQESMLYQLETLFDTIPFVKHFRISNRIYFMDLIAQRVRIETYNKILDEVKEVVVNSEPGLFFVHWPVPHPPGFYDRMRKDYSIKGGSYLDNMVLVDNTIGELRRVMEDAGTWESTTIIFTSDHRWRASMWSEKPLWTEEDYEALLNYNNDHRVPFIIKLAGQNNSFIYNENFNTIITHDLILALLNKDISNYNDLVEWINNNRLRWEIPNYN